MSGVARLLLLALLPLAAAASAAPQDPDPPAAADPLPGTLLTLGEVDARLTVPVGVGTHGPYPFIIDTGAERTVVSRELAGRLGLAAGRAVQLTSMTGTARVETVIVPDLAIRTVGRRHTLTAPALAARNLGAAGLLGIDTLQQHQVSIDFEAGTMTVRPSTPRARKQRRQKDEVVVTARSLFGQLIVTDAYYGQSRIRVVLDTGSQVTMGNSALRRRIGLRVGRTRPIELTSVTGAKAQADYATVAGMTVGDIRFGAMPIAFADVTPFERFGLANRPALLLGMDALRSFRRVDIDFPNRQVRFLLPKGTENELGRWSSPLTGAAGASPTKTY
jgi:predicted aspartyl protease